MMSDNLDQRILECIQKKEPLARDVLCCRFDEILAQHSKSILEGVASPSTENAANLFELVGAEKLAIANKTSRLVSTHLGLAWEEMAALSHLAISPEADFQIRIEGIDIILLENGLLRHTQIKTQKNTLTGSQKGRSLEELKRHPYPLFAAAFNVAAWTFPPLTSSGVERVAGEAFWSKLEIRYDDVIDSARKCFSKLETALFD